MIEAHSMTKRYGEKVAVDDLSFTVRPGIVTGFLGPNGAGQVDDDAPDHRPRLADRRKRHRERQGVSRPPGPVARGRDAARGPRDPHRALGLQPSARARPDARHRRAPRRRGHRPRRAARGGAQARRRLLARHGAAARHRRRAARRPGDADPRRARERPRSRGHPLDPHAAAGSCRGGQDDLRLVPPDERDVADGRPADRRRTRTADRRARRSTTSSARRRATSCGCARPIPSGSRRRSRATRSR